MLELLMGGANGKSFIITPSTYDPKPGNAVNFTVKAQGVGDKRIYWAVLSDSEVTAGFSPLRGSAVPTAGQIAFRVTMPADAANNFKTFRVGLSLVSLEEAADPVTAIAVSDPLTIGELVPAVGQILITAMTTTNFTVPPRVASLSGVFFGATGGGGNSTGGNSGGGGGPAALVYFNDYPVAPGDIFAITIGATDSGFTSSGKDGNSGGALTVKHNNLTICTISGGIGGAAAGSRGQRGLISTLNAKIASYATSRLGTLGETGANGGAGGKSANYRADPPTSFYESLDGGANRVWGCGGNGGVNIGGVASSAKVRLIWGPGRSYPDNALDAPVVT